MIAHLPRSPLPSRVRQHIVGAGDGHLCLPATRPAQGASLLVRRPMGVTVISGVQSQPLG